MARYPQPPPQDRFLFSDGDRDMSSLSKWTDQRKDAEAGWLDGRWSLLEMDERALLAGVLMGQERPVD